METIVKLPAVRIKQDGKTIYATAINAGDLLNIAEVHVWDPDLSDDDEAQGYQRAPLKSHYSKIAKYLHEEEEPLLPTSILISARGELKFTPVGGERSGLGILEINVDDDCLYIVDGQHRSYGINYAITHYKDSRFEDFQMPVTIVEGMEKVDEIQQFYTINTTAKRIRTDLALRLMLAMTEMDDNIRDKSKQKADRWKLRATRITTQLNDQKKSPWCGRIKPPNAPNTPEMKEAVATEASFSTSLKPLLVGGITANLPDEQVIKFLINYWRAIFELVPQAIKSPRKYSLMKTPGMYTLHMVAPKVFELCRDKNEYTVNGIKQILLATHGNGDDYFTAAYWESGAGPASSFNSMGGFRQLAEDIKEYLPDLEVNIAI